MSTTWTTVDERVLRWVLTQPPTLEQPSEIREYPTWQPEPFPEIEGLNTRQVSEALHRLKSHELIDGGDDDMGRTVLWWRLRVRARGLQVLGEWPDLDRIASAVSIRNVVLELAGDAPAEEQTALRKAAGLLGRTSAEVVRDALVERSTPRVLRSSPLIRRRSQ